MLRSLSAWAALALLALPVSLKAAEQGTPSRKSGKFDFVKPVTYADVASRVLDAPLVIEVRARKVSAIPARKAPGLLPGRQRLLVTGDVTSLIRGDGGIAPRITWLVDLAPDSRGKFPPLAKQVLTIAARRVPGFPAEVQLVDPDAQFFMTRDAGQRVRHILASASMADAPPAITGVDAVFHTPGAVAGEGETQIFLSTRSGRPISLSVIEAPDLAPRWSVQLGEAVGDTTPPPPPDTLLWYRLACSLPPRAPAQAMSGDHDDAAARAYAFVIGELGACRRNLPVPNRLAP